MNDYRVTLLRNGQQETCEITAETVKHIEALLPADADVVAVKFLRARGFSCRPRGIERRGQ